MVNVYLHGMLGRKFRKHWALNLNTNSPKEALQAIDMNMGGALVDYFSNKARDKKYIIKLGNYEVRDEAELHATAGNQDIHIVPVVKGAKSGLGKILVGLALVALIVLTPGNTFLLNGALTGWGIVVAGMAASMVLGGVTQLLTPTSNFNNSSTTTNNGSTVFEGNAAQVTQGGSVGLIYGRVLVSPMPISLSFTNEDSITTSNTTVGSVVTTPLPGGGNQYNPGDDIEVDITSP